VGDFINSVLALIVLFQRLELDPACRKLVALTGEGSRLEEFGQTWTSYGRLNHVMRACVRHGLNHWGSGPPSKKWTDPPTELFTLLFGGGLVGVTDCAKLGIPV